MGCVKSTWAFNSFLKSLSKMPHQATKTSPIGDNPYVWGTFPPRCPCWICRKVKSIVSIHTQLKVNIVNDAENFNIHVTVTL